MEYSKGIAFAVMAAMCASVVGIFAKIGMKEVPPVLATALRSIVMMFFCVAIATIMGMGSKLFAVPLSAMEADTHNKRFIFDQSKESLENAPGFDKDDWPTFTDRDWGSSVHQYYGVRPYWE